MKKLLITICTVVSISITAYMIYSIYTKTSDPKDVNPVESFGNQSNFNQNYNSITYKDGNWLYGTDGKYSIIKININEPDKKKIIPVTKKEQHLAPHLVSASNGWIYYIASAEKGSSLCRVKEDGSSKTILLKYVSADYDDYYVLTKNKIYYVDEIPLDSGSGIFDTYTEGDIGIYDMDLDGSSKRLVVGSIDIFEGIDNGWIYYRGGITEESSGYMYRIRSNGKYSEKVFDANRFWDYCFDDGKLFYLLPNDKDENAADQEDCTIAREEDGRKTTLTTISYSTLTSWSLNKEGNWLYFVDGEKACKMNVEENGKKEVIYNAKENDSVNSISLYDGDVLVNTVDEGAVYVKKDGTIIHLGNIGH